MHCLSVLHADAAGSPRRAQQQAVLCSPACKQALQAEPLLRTGAQLLVRPEDGVKMVAQPHGDEAHLLSRTSRLVLHAACSLCICLSWV